MCVDLELSERHRRKRNRRWRFHRLRDTSRMLEDGGIDNRPSTKRRLKRIDHRPVLLIGRPEPAVFATSEVLTASAAASQRLQASKDARRFAEQYPFAGLSAA